MIAQEQLVQIIKCPTCQWQVTLYMTDLHGRLRLQCNRCNQVILDWMGRTPQTVESTSASSLLDFAEPSRTPQTVESTLPQEIQFQKEASSTIWEPGQLKKVGDYSLLKLIGQGSVGEVYLGEHSGKNSAGRAMPPRVVVKVLSEKIPDTTRERFLQEAKVHSVLCKDSIHPNIVQLYDVGYCTKTSRLYLVMEYIEGGNLDECLSTKGRLSERHSLQVAMGVARALEHALKYHIIHRDLKPANILLDRISRKAKVADLGLGKIVTEKGMTLDGEFMGTPHYMAPEQIRNAKDTDHLADIYALGATLYHMLAGRPPYAELMGALPVLRAKMTHDPIPMSEFVPTINQAMTVLVNRAMARDKKARYETPTQMIEDMQKLLEIFKVEK